MVLYRLRVLRVNNQDATVDIPPGWVPIRYEVYADQTTGEYLYEIIALEPLVATQPVVGQPVQQQLTSQQMAQQQQLIQQQLAQQQRMMQQHLPAQSAKRQQAAEKITDNVTRPQ